MQRTLLLLKKNYNYDFSEQKTCGHFAVWCFAVAHSGDCHAVYNGSKLDLN